MHSPVPQRAAAVAVLIGTLVLLSVPAAGTHPAVRTVDHPAADALDVLSITQSPTITAHSTFTIRMQVSNTSDIHFVYFLFCQLTNALCYSPVVMNDTGDGWYVGTTSPMTSYPGMNPGVFAGYNITIELDDNVNLTEPTLPNAFSNLTVATSVSGEYMYQMQVHPLVFSVNGVVTDQSTGKPITGAVVSETPGNNTTTTNSAGQYTFGSLVNGTYQISVTYAGYKSTVQSVKVGGTDVVENIPITNSSATAPPPSKSSGGGFPTIDYEYGVVAVIAVAVVFGALWAVRRPKKPTEAMEPGTSSP